MCSAKKHSRKTRVRLYSDGNQTLLFLYVELRLGSDRKILDVQDDSLSSSSDPESFGSKLFMLYYKNIVYNFSI